ncbi:MAG: NFACT family protein [Nanoarchaeota archaeon]|nr:NFACT family protein [Nanoarchaeota archaeon]
MIPQSGFDIKVIVNELKELNNSRIEKFYNTPEGELLIKIYSSKYGKVVLRALRGECIHLTDFKREVVEQPSMFTMVMRKYMNGSIIQDIEQPSFERVVIFKIKRGEEFFKIIIELFNKGNIVICNEEGVIINSLRFIKVKDRVIRPGEAYELPAPKFHEEYIDNIEFKRVIKGSDKESIVKSLAIDIGLGGKYAEELCTLAELDKNASPGLVSCQEIDKLFEIFFLMYKSVKHYMNIRPCVIIKEKNIINFSPFPFKSYQDCEFKFFETYNEANDYYYSESQKTEHEEAAQKSYDNKINQLENRLEQQEENLKFLEEESKRLAKLGELVFANYDLINTIITKIKQANKSNVDWNTIKAMVEKDNENGSVEAQSIKSINEEDGTITLIIEGQEFTVSLSTNATELAQEFFEKSKKLKAKIDGTEDSINQTREKINHVEEKGVEEVNKIIEKKKIEEKWYNKYRWLKTSNNFLLVCGKDATQNEILVKKVAEDNDLIFHASIAGSPFGILKDGKNAENQDKQEAAQFIASYSRAWRENIPTDVFSVSKEQVTKTAPSGEYVAHGSFIIKGEKEYFRGLWPELRIGYTSNGEVIAGPSELMYKQCENSVSLTPGSINPGKVSKRLMSMFDKRAFTSEEFLHFIPGDSMIGL